MKDIIYYLESVCANNLKTIELLANGGRRQPVILVEDGFKCRACILITKSEKKANLYWKAAGHMLEGAWYTKV